MSLKELIGDPAWLFDIGVPLPHFEKTKSVRLDSFDGWSLDEKFTLPNLASLSNVKTEGCQFRIGWNDAGLLFELHVSPAKTSSSGVRDPQSRLVLIVDTRSAPGVHRATNYCHWFDFKIQEPYLQPHEQAVRYEGHQIAIPRAKASPRLAEPEEFYAWRCAQKKLITIRAFLPAEVLNGYHPQEFPELGIFLFFSERSFGRVSFARALDTFPVDDPSLWCQVKLTR